MEQRKSFILTELLRIIIMSDYFVYSPCSISYRSQTTAQFVESAALAFENYPMFNYILGNNSKARDIRIILSASLKASSMDWICLSSNGNKVSLAIFYPPGFKDTKTIPFLLCGGLRLLMKNKFKAIPRLAIYENYAMKIMSKYVDDRCWYLQSFTVHPYYQKQGVASKTLKPMLDFFDATGQRCFLETNTQSNIALYEHFGFKVVETGIIPGSDVPHFAMIREPKNRDKDVTNG